MTDRVKLIYEAPLLDVIEIESESVIAASGDLMDDMNPLPPSPYSNSNPQTGFENKKVFRRFSERE